MSLLCLRWRTLATATSFATAVHNLLEAARHRAAGNRNVMVVSNLWRTSSRWASAAMRSGPPASTR
eukprot:6373689-Prymnesium_polylepis.1